MDIKKLSKDIASALEDHALIAWDQQNTTAQIVHSFVNEFIKKEIREFYD
tara:strand:- start:494 stop:643 length:150 start_codon:yes stop_codon:yes gene_type:complete